MRLQFLLVKIIIMSPKLPKRSKYKTFLYLKCWLIWKKNLEPSLPALLDFPGLAFLMELHKASSLQIKQQKEKK